MISEASDGECSDSDFGLSDAQFTKLATVMMGGGSNDVSDADSEEKQEQFDFGPAEEEFGAICKAMSARQSIGGCSEDVLEAGLQASKEFHSKASGKERVHESDDVGRRPSINKLSTDILRKRLTRFSLSIDSGRSDSDFGLSDEQISRLASTLTRESDSSVMQETESVRYRMMTDSASPSLDTEARDSDFGFDSAQLDLICKTMADVNRKRGSSGDVLEAGLRAVEELKRNSRGSIPASNTSSGRHSCE
eukprot:TRINITY_DN10768_c1_g1_i12.p1 TRINITY_DN10768_c1_g1~~TRINITY_DN10768_c1_g1_i12.p1  ORF type:complete len:284 (+),score=59.58 TRINITY_DN10768_c1_g1_i12:105-854(+)